MRNRFLIAAALLCIIFSGCTSHEIADTVVYGTIRTVEDDVPTAEAVAIKDGKYIFVGDKAGAKAFVKEGVTEVIDHTGKGIVMPSCTDGHSHYIMGHTLPLFSVMIGDQEGTEIFYEKIKAAYAEAKANGKHNIFGFGWNFYIFQAEGMPTRQQLDEICPDMALYINDGEGHKGLANTLCLQNAGIIDTDGNVLISEVSGGKISMGADGKPDGLLLEQAGTYVKLHGIDFSDLLTPDLAEKAIEATRDHLLSNGYTCYMDGWSNYFATDSYYKAAKDLDERNELNINLGLSYEIESWCKNVDAEIDVTKEWADKYATKHVSPYFLKIFMDGTLEGGTGFTTNPYPAGGNGIANWSQEEVNDITANANGKGITMHVHAMGDAAINRCVNAFSEYGKKELRNTIVHLRNVNKSDYQRIADNNICCTVGILWHIMSDEYRDILTAVMPEGCKDNSYPIKSHLDCGTVVTSSCDFPATSGSPYRPFELMEIAVTGSILNPFNGEYTTPWNTEELVTREQMLKILTINGAWQLHQENERGSIKVGKYADFIILDNDILECPERQISKTNVLSTWFEGKKVFENK